MSAPELSDEDIAAKQIWDSVSASRDPVQILLFLRAHPESRYAQEARAMLNELMAAELNPGWENAEPAQIPETEIAALNPETPQAPSEQLPARVTFSEPLVTSGPGIEGPSIEQLIVGLPRFPPLEGLPEELWKDKNCSNCHEWTRTALCDQAMTYLGDNAIRSLSKKHPYSGIFKRGLKVWATGNCQ